LKKPKYRVKHILKITKTLKYEKVVTLDEGIARVLTLVGKDYGTASVVRANIDLELLNEQGKWQSWVDDNGHDIIDILNVEVFENV